MPISKTDFVRGLQCEKMLWLDAHAPEHKIIPPEVQARLDEGNAFGDRAMGIFGAFVEATTYKDDGRLNFSAMLEKTKTLVENGEDVVCEGAFSWYGNFCAVDILRRGQTGFSLYEVKNATLPRDEFITDLGFQRLIVRKCGLPILSSFLVLRGDDEDANAQTPSAEYIEHAGFVYKIVDVTQRAKRAEFLASQRVFELGKLKKKDTPTPNIPVGEQCEKPYRCWYYDFCHDNGKT